MFDYHLAIKMLNADFVADTLNFRVVGFNERIINRKT